MEIDEKEYEEMAEEIERLRGFVREAGLILQRCAGNLSEYQYNETVEMAYDIAARAEAILEDK